MSRRRQGCMLPLGPMFSFFMQFLGKTGQNNSLAPHLWADTPCLGIPGSTADD